MHFSQTSQVKNSPDIIPDKLRLQITDSQITKGRISEGWITEGLLYPNLLDPPSYTLLILNAFIVETLSHLYRE